MFLEIEMYRFYTLLIVSLLSISGNALASSNTLLPDVKALALDRLVLDRSNAPISVLETAPILNSKGEIAKGMTEVTLTLDASAKNAIIVQGKTLKPGKSLTLVQDLSITGGALKIPIYPATSNLAGVSHYTIDIPKVTAELCADDYVHDKLAKNCFKVNTTNLLYQCPDSSWKATGDLRNCIQQTSIAKESCPIGFDTNGDGTCTKTELKPTVPECTTGYAYSTTNKRCEKTLTESAYKTCSDPSYTYQASTNDCRKTVTKPVSYDCAAGYTYNTSIKKCERTLIATADKVCATGYTFSAANNRCEKPTSVGANPVCQSGYSYSVGNKRCEKTLTQTASKVCTTGYAYISARNRCEKTTTLNAAPVCVSGYSYSSSNKRCEKTQVITASKVCASGYTYSSGNNRCEKTTTLAASKICTSGYTYSSANNRCEKTTTVAASKICASGYSYSSGNNRCEKIVTLTASKVCASGYTYRNSRCEKTVVQAAGKVCSSGYTYSSTNNRCEKTNTQAATKVCSSGYTYSSTNRRCEKTVTVAASKVCASGYTYSSTQNRCEKKVTASAICASGYNYNRATNNCQKVLTTSKICASNQRLTSNGLCHAKTGQFACDKYENQHGYAYCDFSTSTNDCTCWNYNDFTYSTLPSKCSYGSFGVIGGACVKPTGEEPSSCPSDYSASGGVCKKTTTAVATCSSGYTLNVSTDRCEKLLAVSFTYSCPSGYSRSGSTCNKLVTKSYTYSCPSGYSRSGSTCSQLVTKNFTYSCPSGYSRSGSTCSKLVTKSFTYSCPSGYSRSGSTCSKLVTQSYTYSCPSGYSRSGSTCSQLVSKSFTYSCPSGYSRSGSTCSKLNTANFTYSCSSRYTLSGSSCSRLLTQTNSWSCGTGFSLSGSICSKTEIRVFAYSCPNDYTLSGSTCSKGISVANTWTCAAGTTLSGSHCLGTDLLSFSYSCSSNYVNHNNGSCSRYQSSGYSLSCSDRDYSPSSSTEICERVLNIAHIYKCNDLSYTLGGSSCSLLITKKESWICDDPGYTKILGTVCQKKTDSALTGKCPAGYLKDGAICNYYSSIDQIEYCPETYARSGNECQKNVFSAPGCPTGLLDSSCVCPAGKTLNQSTWMCEGIQKTVLSTKCPTGYVVNGNKCDYTNQVNVVYDYCPSGMVSSGTNCLLDVVIPATQSCNSPYAIIDGRCEYTNLLPEGYGGGGTEEKSFEGDFIAETSSVQLANTEFDAVVSQINEIAIDVTGGCRLVSTDSLAQGVIRKGDVPCTLTWNSLPDGIFSTNNTLTGIFSQAGTQNITYQLKGFNGSSKDAFLIAEGEITVEVSMPTQPEVTDITTRMMNKVVRGFEVYNYSSTSKINLTTTIVEPKNYAQVVEIENIGTCSVAAGETSCNIYSSEQFVRDESKLTFDSVYKVWSNSKVGGWNKVNLTPKDWTIHHDFRGPTILFTEFNAKAENAPVVNEDLGFSVIVNGGEGAIGISNIRSELASDERWWKPTKVNLEFIAEDGKLSVSTINVNDTDVIFDVPNSTGQNQLLTNNKVLEEEGGIAYPFLMSSLTPGHYTVKITAKDSFNNESVTTVENINVGTPKPQIKILLKKRPISKTSIPTFYMLDDVMIVAHNGFEGDSTITSVKIDGKEALTTNGDSHFKLLTGEGFDLVANQTYQMVVEARDTNGAVTESSISFNYLRMMFGFQRKPKTVIQLVEDVNLKVSRTRGLRCDIYGTKSAAALAANDYNHACYIEWTTLPNGLSSQTATYQASAVGGVSNLGNITAAFDAFIVNKAGKASKIVSDEITFESLPPQPIRMELDERLKLADGIYSISVTGRQIGRYQGTSSRANIDVELSNDSGDSKHYKHNQLPFGETQNFSAYADKLGDALLWDKVSYQLKGQYRLAPEMSDTVNFDLVVTPHPYMQVLMDLDSNRYASTESIEATIKLGIKNNLTNTFDYNVETMGIGWDVYIAFKKGTKYEPITAPVPIGTDGKGIIQVDADIIFNRNEAIYAVAEARSPYPEIEIQRVSVPRSITVVKGTAVEGKIVSRVVHARIPANFDFRFDTKSYQDFRVMGDIEWQRNDGSSWVEMSDLAGRQYVSVKSVSPETIDIRAIITNKETGAITESETIRLISYDKPSMKIEGKSQAIAGQMIELTATDSNTSAQGDTVVEWSLDGETWVQGFDKFTVNIEESNILVKGRMKYANTADDIKTGHWSPAVKYISVTRPKPLIMSMVKPAMVEIGTEISLKMMISNSFSGTGVPVKTEWLLPDGTMIEDAMEIKYVLAEEDLDDLNRVTVIANAWLEGFKNVTLGESVGVMNTFSYQFPSESDLSLTVNNNIKYVPSTGYATVNMPYINAPGVRFTYDWTYDQTAIEEISTSGKGFSFKVIEAGVHSIMATVSDNRGNFHHITGYVDAIEPNVLEFKMNDVYSNKYMRAPLTASFYPNVKIGHPYDYVKEYVWTVNGVQGEVSSRAIGAFNDLGVGHYEIDLHVTTNFGQTGTTTFAIDVKANKIPVCAPSIRKQYGIHIVDANCKDEDGKITYYRWVVNGTVFSPYGPQVRFNEATFPTASIVIEAVDDAGGTGVGHASF